MKDDVNRAVALLHSFWQVALIAALYALAATGLRRRSANARYVAGCVALALMVALPAATAVLAPGPGRPAVPTISEKRVRSRIG